jgi:hypothetical protein
MEINLLAEEVRMEIPLYQVDAFTGQVFHGNPAAVCLLEAWLDDETMRAIAAENNLSETAFFVRRGKATRCAGHPQGRGRSVRPRDAGIRLRDPRDP